MISESTEAVAKRGRKVLVVIVGDYEVTGVVTFLEERLPRLIQLCKCEITLFVPGRVVEAERAARLRRSGVRILEASIDLDDPVARRRGLRGSLRAVFETEHFDVVHVNTASRLVNLIALSEAKRVGVPVRIAHSHNANHTLSCVAHMAEPWYQLRIVGAGTHFLACSDEAGEFLIGKHAWKRRGKVIRNGIDIAKYSFSQKCRDKLRDDLLDNPESLVYGYIGRLTDQKNPLFLIEIFLEIAERDSAAEFWVVGDGPLAGEAKNIARNSEHAEKFIFFGMRTDVNSLICGMDALVLPSKWEGLPLTLLEGECSGLPCFVSDVVPREAAISGCSVTYISLGDDACVWADTITKTNLQRNCQGSIAVREAGYAIERSVDSLLEYYN